MSNNQAAQNVKVDEAKREVARHVSKLGNLTDAQRVRVLRQAHSWVVTHSGDISVVDGVCVLPHVENIANYVRSLPPRPAFAQHHS
jgi:hypothetical protein